MPVFKSCEECGKRYSSPPSEAERRRFCSDKCFYTWLERFERAQYIDVKCLNCGKSLHLLKSRYKDNHGRYCSQKCMIAKRQYKTWVNKVKRTCQHCGKEFEVYPSQMKRDRDAKFCSRSCVISHTNQKMRLNSPTKIEVLIMSELDKRRIKYAKEFSISRWTIDIAFPEYRIAVEADGSYWHGLKNVKEKDRRKDKDLKQRGWTILHFREDEINKNVSRCVDVIEKHLKS